MLLQGQGLRILEQFSVKVLGLKNRRGRVLMGSIYHTVSVVVVWFCVESCDRSVCLARKCMSKKKYCVVSAPHINDG